MMNFTASVLEIVKDIPRGKVTTYGEIATVIGDRKFARAVGRALNSNPYPVDIPCHRVVMSDGSIGGYKGGVGKKVKLLKKEGIKIKNNKIVNFKSVMFRFP